MANPTQGQIWPPGLLLVLMGTRLLCSALAVPEAEPLPLALPEPEAFPEASPWPEPIPMPWAFPDSDPWPQAASTTGGGCGPPRLSSPWPNTTTSHGQPFKLSCPLDTRNSCLVDRVEWYFSEREPGVPSSGTTSARRKLLKHMALAFDPLMLYFPSVSQEHSGWYTCMVGNSQGMSEASTFLDVRHRRGTRRRFQSRPSQAVPVQQQQQQQQQQQRIVPTQTQSQTSELREDTEDRDGVQSRFSVYARFRGDRGFRNPSQPAPQALQRQDLTRQPNQGTIATVERNHEQGLDAVHQHLRYIYDKVDQIDNQMTNIEQRISRLERN